MIMYYRKLQEVYRDALTKRYAHVYESGEDPAVRAPASPARAPYSKEEEILIDRLDSKIAVAKVNLWEAAPDLCRILSQLNIIVVRLNDPNVNTMAVDNFGNIYINPGFGNELTDDEFNAVFAHEAMHIANGTFLRKDDRDHHIWNIATDAIMNWGLLHDGFNLPKKAILPDINTGKVNLGPLGEISVLDKNGFPFSAEEIYSDIMEKNRKIKITKRQLPPGVTVEAEQKKLDVQNKKINPNYKLVTVNEAKVIGGGGYSGPINPNQQAQPQGEWVMEYEFPDGTKKVEPLPPPPPPPPGSSGKSGYSGRDPGRDPGGEPGGEPGEPGDEPGEPGDEPGEPGDKPGEPGGKPKHKYTDDKPEQRVGGANKKLSDEEMQKAIEDYLKSIADRAVDKHLTDEQARQSGATDEDMTPQRIKELEQQRQDDIKRGQVEAKSHSNPGRSGGKGVGNGGIRKVVATSIPIRIDWKGFIKQYLLQSGSGFTTWMRPSKRSLAGGYQSPSRMPASNKLEAVFAVDTSGSIGTDDLNHMFNYIKQIANEVRDINIRICLWHHTAYYLSSPITDKGALESALKRITAESGGTEISSVAPFLKKMNVTPFLVIFMTDGFTEEQPVFGSYKKLFVIVNSGAKNPDIQQNMNNKFARHGKMIIVRSLDT